MEKASMDHTVDNAHCTDNNSNGTFRDVQTNSSSPYRDIRNLRYCEGQGRGGRSARYGSSRNRPVFFGPFAEYATPPPAVFDVPPRVLPVHMFNANMVPPCERNAQFETQFAPFVNHFPSCHLVDAPVNDGSSAMVSSASPSSNYRIKRGGKTHGSGGRGGSRERPNFHRDILSDQLSLLTLDNGEVDNQDGYGCPPSYVLESYRNQVEMDSVPTAVSNTLNKADGNREFSDAIPEGYAQNEDKPLATLRDRLKKDLEEENYECMICCQVIRANQWIWTCKKCYHMFHINRSSSYGCITQWAAKSYGENVGWRCPSCQNISYEFPMQYSCFCGKKINPPTQRFPDTPHTCNEVCGKIRSEGCPHPCTDQCHPGPCIDCPVTITQKCNCGRQIVSVRCGKQLELKCSEVCGKILNCGVHKCEVVCHQGECNTCEHVIAQKCFCGLEERIVPCTALNLKNGSFSCGTPCTGMYACGIHNCILRCHEKYDKNNCGLCILSPEKRKHCPCGRTLIAELVKEPRLSCTDLIPTCKNICNKILSCGSEDKPHRCMQLCHTGPCPPCSLNSSIVCRCRALKKTIPCKEFILYSTNNPYLCERRCRKMKSCQNHRCQAVCCIDEEHVCLQVCGKKLNCGIHSCDRLCHVGQCHRCLEASFEEQYCLCGHTFREPPVPCGTSLPPCDQPCSRQHPCEHPPMHNCHAEPECPPCTVLTQKFCYGGHEIRANIPCYLNDVSCGYPCDKKLPCGIHRCRRTCHAGECLSDNASCQQPCINKRVGEACDHICGLPCHSNSPCPKSVCMVKVSVTCPCLHKSAEMRCFDVERLYLKTLSLEIMEDTEQKPCAEKRILKRTSSMDKYRCLSCDAECQRALRNKKVGEALNISDREASGAGVITLTYTNFLKNHLKTNYKLITEVEDALVELVQDLHDQPTISALSHAFRPMNSELRRIIHEYAGYFGIETISYDQEPQRNVVATAKRDVSHVPRILLTATAEPIAVSSGAASNGLATTSTKAIPSVSKDFSWATENGMQQLQSTGKVLKRGCKNSQK